MITYKEQLPIIEEYLELRASANWKVPSDTRAFFSLKASPLGVCAYDGRKIIGMVRLAGDLEMYGYIQDTIVLPEYQSKGIGTHMVNKLISRIRHLEGYLLGVCPSKVSVKFYQQFGFVKRPENPNGFMSMEMKQKIYKLHKHNSKTSERGLI